MTSRLGQPSCVFCGGARAARSRVLPAWLDDCFADHAPVGARRRIACRSCLRGWLARVDDGGRALVGWLAAGRPFVLAQQNQEALARWSAKTILTLQAVRDRELLAPAVYRDLMERRIPPAGFRIALGARPREDNWPYRFSSLGSAATARDWDVAPTFDGAQIDHYRAELCVGHLVIRASARFAPQGHVFDSGNAIEIWPPRSPARWPPPLERPQAAHAARRAAA